MSFGRDFFSGVIFFLNETFVFFLNPGDFSGCGPFREGQLGRDTHCSGELRGQGAFALGASELRTLR